MQGKYGEKAGARRETALLVGEKLEKERQAVGTVSEGTGVGKFRLLYPPKWIKDGKWFELWFTAGAVFRQGGGGRGS